MDIVRGSSRLGRIAALLGVLGGVCVAVPAAAQGVPYKVTGPDGRVTYTDRPAQDARSVQALGDAAKSAPATSAWLTGLPFALRQVAQRFPVMLYTTAGCSPCDQARQSLQQRGVPFQEFKVEPGAGPELQRREGTRTLPVARVGQQQLVGFEVGEWQQTLNVAGYPATSALPAGWQPPAVQTLSPPQASKDETEPVRVSPAPRVVPEAQEPTLPTKRFRF